MSSFKKAVVDAIKAVRNVFSDEDAEKYYDSNEQAIRYHLMVETESSETNVEQNVLDTDRGVLNLMMKLFIDGVNNESGQ